MYNYSLNVNLGICLKIYTKVIQKIPNIYARTSPDDISPDTSIVISVTSTVIVMRILEELGLVKEEATIMILGVAIIEDIIIISMLAILQSVSSSGELFGIDLVISIVTVLAFIGGALFIGSKTIPRFVNLIGKTNQHDVIVVAILGVAFGLSFLSNRCLNIFHLFLSISVAIRYEGTVRPINSIS